MNTSIPFDFYNASYYKGDAHVLNQLSIPEWKAGSRWNEWAFNTSRIHDTKLLFPDEDTFIKFCSGRIIRNSGSYGTYFGLKYDNSPQILCLYGACFGSLADFPYQKKTKLVSIYHRIFYNTKEERDNSVDYLSFIFDEKKSPWRKFIPLVKLHFNGDKDWKNLVCVEAMDLDKNPIQPVMSLLWAVRMVYEHPSIIKEWNDFVKAGLTQLQALYATTFVYKSGTILLKRSSPGHCWFSNNTGSLSFKRLKEGEPVFDKFTLQQQGTYNGTLYIWNIGGRSTDDYYTPVPWMYKDTKKPFSLDGLTANAQKYTGVFSSLFQLYNGSNYFKDTNGTNFGTVDQFVEKFNRIEEFKDE